MLPIFETFFSHMPTALLVIFRMGGLLIFAPILGSSVIPARMKVALSFGFGLAAYPALLASGAVEPGLPLALWSLLPLIALEIALGATIGFIASMPLLAMQVGGLMMGQQMGLGFARFYNPAVEDEADILAQLLLFLTLMAFFAVGGHEGLFLAVLHSFEHVPLGGFTPDLGLDLICGLFVAAFETAMRVAAPLLTIIMLETVALGFVARSVPQLNILSLGFPLRILVGFIVVMLGLMVIHDVITDDIAATFDAIFDWLQAQGDGHGR